MKVLLCHPGTQYSHQLAKQLAARGLLFQFWTGFALARNSTLNKLIGLGGGKLTRKISNRIIDGLTANQIKNAPLLEWRALKKIAKGMSSEEVFYERNKAFQERIPDSVLQKADVVIGFDSSSWILAERCKNLGIRFVLDVSIAHPVSKEKVYQKLRDKFPEWNFAIENKTAFLIALEQKELQLAHTIVAASSFTKRTLIENGVPESGIMVNPYGVDSNAFRPGAAKHRNVLKFLFTGKVDVRKGIPLLIDSWKKVTGRNEELELVGPITDEIGKLIPKESNIHATGKVPFKDLPVIIADKDVFVFPSYFEGFGLVILEAMACGLPVITTAATCAPDVIMNGKEGFIIDPNKPEELEQAIKFFIDKPGMAVEMGKNAREKAVEFSWNAYGDRWEKIIRNKYNDNEKN